MRDCFFRSKDDDRAVLGVNTVNIGGLNRKANPCKGQSAIAIRSDVR